ncbi:MAG TPA: primase C-terminal domain-containing protein [Virgibacillus sp.]|nr:primase C-terminal domain-containing protein [Virgibacillus sp.]
MPANNIHPIDVIHFMTNQDLYMYKRKNSKGHFHDLVRYDSTMQNTKTGTVFVTHCKDDLTDGKGLVVTSYETLAAKYDKLSHWTPNTFRGGTYYDFSKRKIKGHTKNNLKQINTIGFDIDTKDVDLYTLFMACDELNLPWPNIVLETPRGYQGFFVLETPFYIHKQGDYKALRVAERLSSNILNALSAYAPIDTNCNPFGFYRVPNDNNIIYFDDHSANTASLIEWSKSYEHEQKKQQFQVIYGGQQASACQYVSSDWYRAILQTTTIRAGEYASSRNNALLTLALANYTDGIAYETAYDVLDQWNSALQHPLSLQEFERTLKSAYSGRYKGVKRSYVESLLENWTDGSATFSGQNGWYKFKKNREDRIRSHYEEWEQDIMQYIHKHTSPQKPFLQGSLRMLAEKIGIPFSTFKEVMKRAKNLYKKTEGRGRAAVTYITTKSMLFNHLIAIQKKGIKSVQLLLDIVFLQPTKLNKHPFSNPNPILSFSDTS